MKRVSRFGAGLCALLVCAFAGSAFADGHGNPGPDIAQPPVHAAPIPATTASQGRSGEINLNQGGLTLNVPSGYRYYSPENAYAFLQRNNAPAGACTVLGMVAPANERVDRAGAWATIVGYKDIGYVPANTASGLTAPNFETDVRAARQAANRPFEGFAVQHAFDDTASGLSWAERSAAPGAGGKDLRYEQDKLGRRGVACMTSIGSADQMSAMIAAAPDLYSMVSFSAGQTYADFVPGTDTVSAFTVPALVTGVAPPPPQALVSTTTETTQGGFAGLGRYFPWIAIGLIVLAGLGYMMTRRRRDPSPDQ